MKFPFSIGNDMAAYCEAKGIDVVVLAALCGIPRSSLQATIQGKFMPEVYEAFYSRLWGEGFRPEESRKEFLVENAHQDDLVLFLGVKNCISEIDSLVSASNSDFGTGVYLNEHFNEALKCIEDERGSSVLAFMLQTEGLKIKEYACDEEWMILVSHFHGYLNDFTDSPRLKDIVDGIKDVDILVAPIVDNLMLQSMSEFSRGRISSSEALHSISASTIGRQYALKSERAMERLRFLWRSYASNLMRNASLQGSGERLELIESKRMEARLLYRRAGSFVEEIL